MGVKEIVKQLEEWAYEEEKPIFTKAQLDCKDEIQYIEWE